MSHRLSRSIRTSRLLAFPAVALVLAFLVALAGCGSESSSGQASTTNESGPTVRTVHAEVAQSVVTDGARSFSGTLRAPLETNLSFRVPGQVTDVLVDVGTRVQAGELIARLDPEDYRLEVEAARASYRRAKAAAENARAELKRIKALYANDNTSLSAYDRARTRYETAKNQAEAAKRQLDLAEKRLGYTRLTAPASGSIANRTVEEGENVSVGQPVARLTAGDALEMRVQVPEELIAKIQVGQRAAVTATSLDESRPATVSEVASAPDGRRPTYPVVVSLNEPVESLRSGMTGRVRFNLGSTDAVILPSAAVSQDQNGRYAYVIDQTASLDDSLNADGRIARRRVEIGELTPRGIVVHQGVEVDERVVTAGMSDVRPGDPVRISRLFTSDDGS